MKKHKFSKISRKKYPRYFIPNNQIWIGKIMYIVYYAYKSSPIIIYSNGKKSQPSGFPWKLYSNPSMESCMQKGVWREAPEEEIVLL